MNNNMMKKWVIGGLCILLLIAVLFHSNNSIKEGVSIQNGTTISIQLSGLQEQINTTNAELTKLFSTILTLPVNDITPYTQIINMPSSTPPLTIYQKLNEVVSRNQKGMGTQKADAQLIYTFMSNDPSFKSVNDTNTALNSAFSTIVGLNLQDNVYTDILSNTSITPIDKYNQLMVLVNNKTNWG
jgi:preprotein translocase subunit SecF